MATAFVLINTTVGAEESVLEELKNFPEVKEAYQVFGVYDIIIWLETGAMDEIKDVINRRIRRLVDIKSTLTMIEVE